MGIPQCVYCSNVDMKCLSLLFTTRDFAKIRLRHSNGEQREVIVENLSSFQSSSTLYFGYNTHTSYQGPDSRNTALKPYLFLGFLPESLVRNYGTQGFRAAGRDFTFTNCDANPNSYITFYYNPNNESPGRLGDSNSFMTGWIDGSTVLSVNSYMDSDFYFDWEMHMGGCGGFMTSHYMSNSRAALGLPFINGLWSDWDPFGTCSVSCGGGIQHSSRRCNNPEPAHGGLDCIGKDSKSQSCSIQGCPVDGRWTEWSAWSDCPVTCSGEDLIRSRSCTNPSPENKGKECEGSNSDVMSCYKAKCQVNGEWTAWTPWTNCPETCNDETLNRTRSCSNPAPENGGTDCQGLDKEFMSCHTAQCPVDGGWTEWSVWSDCPDTCSDEDLIRTRSCTNPSPENDGKSCEGSNSEIMSCYTAKCPVDGNWANWTPWTECPETCKDENINRTRFCSNPIPENNGNECIGNDTEFMSCHTAKCPVFGEWTSWSSWSDCPESCDGEILSKERNCTNPVPTNGGRYCIGNETDTSSCETVGCPTRGEISQSMGSGYTRIRLNWSLVGILTAVIIVFGGFS
ncbi:Coadhesin,Hemicentin-1,Mucin-like protein,Thrombospondin-1 [Mytilus coruscus]|uniref:Coadhesin,Hemicentin-1,Mucin-like protein,Thrombospondin-1 n=1 Tax=Mytilus coruscus TaxID=42192 RepID=A0A6J8BE74_MYTCO|nr:Coadhesin,Hemicentin-1,Mucin-like protein,Thrombospondin-1 [Mytilus coruscus]